MLAEDKLFATLDPTSRALSLPDGREVLLIDTVGLVRRLPHQLVEAFKSTLEEAVNADLLWCVCDASSDETDEQVAVTRHLMEELGVGDKPMLVLLNKCDLISEAPLLFGERTVLLSAKTGFGFGDLLQKTAAALAPTHRRLRLLIPYDRSGLVNEIMAGGRVFSQEYAPEGTKLDALVDVKILHKVAEFALHGE